jgi:hypothetical protein
MAATRQWRAARRAQRGQRRLTGGTHLSAFSELKLPQMKIIQNKYLRIEKFIEKIVEVGNQI